MCLRSLSQHNHYSLMCFIACAQHKHQIPMCFRARTQHKHQITHVLQSLRSTQTSNHSCALELVLNTNIKSLMCSRAHAQHKHLINYVLQGPRPTHEIIYMLNKTYGFGLRPIYQTNHHSHVQWGLMPNIQNITSKKHRMQWDLCP